MLPLAVDRAKPFKKISLCARINLYLLFKLLQNQNKQYIKLVDRAKLFKKHHYVKPKLTVQAHG